MTCYDSRMGELSYSYVFISDSFPYDVCDYSVMYTPFGLLLTATADLLDTTLTFIGCYRIRPREQP